MDGVMLDSEPLQLRSFNFVLARSSISVSMSDFKAKYMGSRDTQICEKMISDFNLPISMEEFVQEKRSAYLALFKEEGIPPTEGLVDAVSALHKMLPLGIASSSQVQDIETITTKFGIRDLFKVILSGHQVPNGKPAPDVYLKVSEMLGIEPGLCGVIEDTVTGIRSAKSAGMSCIGITTTHSSDELQGADIIIDSFDELLGAVAQL